MSLSARYLIPILVILAGCSDRKFIEAPIESCTESATGRTKSYEVQGACLVQQNIGNVPVCTMYQQIPVTDHEVVVKCEFAIWR